MRHATLFLFVISLAVGGTATALAYQTAQIYRSKTGRAFFSHILYYNLLVLLGLVFKYIFLNLTASVPPGNRVVISTLFLDALAVVKLVWIYAFIRLIMVLREETPSPALKRAFRAVCLLAGGILVTGVFQTLFSGEAVITVFLSGGLEYLALIAGAGYSMSLLSPRDRKGLIRLFGYINVIFFFTVLAALPAGSIFLGISGYIELFSGLSILAYNIITVLWLRRFSRMEQQEAQPSTGGEEHMATLFEKHGISAREQEIVHLVCRGKTNREISDLLYISIQTVKDHNTSIYRKIGVRNRVELTNFFRRPIKE